MATSAPDPDAHLLADARRHLDGLWRPRPWRYWLELAGSGAVGWTALLLAAAGGLGAPATLAAVVVASLALHRASVFLHELAHLPRRAVPGLRLAWNAVWGVPFFLPSWLYERFHLEHHRRAVYGTPGDPEYVPVARLPRWTVFLAGLAGLLLPLALLLRFLALAPAGWLSPGLRRTIDARFSALVANPHWRAPEPDRALSRFMRLSELLCFLWGWGLLALALQGWLPARALLVPLAVLGGAVALNQLRAQATHRGASDGQPGDEVAMVRDSVNVEVSLPERLVFPMAVHLHALHHLLPGIPFHHLEEAHRRLTAALPPDSAYRRASAPGLLAALRQLYTPVRLPPVPPRAEAP